MTHSESKNKYQLTVQFTEENSTICCDQIKTVDASTALKYYYTLDKEVLEELQELIYEMLLVDDSNVIVQQNIKPKGDNNMVRIKEGLAVSSDLKREITNNFVKFPKAELEKMYPGYKWGDIISIVRAN